MKRSIISLVVLMPLVLSAQAPRDLAPLKYWPAPLYWQPTQAESRMAVKSEMFSVAAAKAPTPAATSLVFIAMTPCRIADTRAGFGFSGAFGPPSLLPGITRIFPIQSSTTCSIPATAQAYSLNLTVVPPGFMNYLTIWPVGATQPNASTLNSPLGAIVANAAIVPAGNDATGSVNVFVSDSTNLIIDINGYYAPQSAITLTQGSAGAPSMNFTGDPGTGIFSSGPGNVNITTGGTNAFSVISTGDIDVPGSIRKNGNLFLHNLGTQNTSVGLTALNSLSSGSFNTAIGYTALQNDSTGGDNTAIGVQALGSNTSGCCNSALGVQALLANTTGANNSAFGVQSGLFNTTGTYNTAQGYQSLYFNTVGTNNTAMGYTALYNNVSGGNNIAIGSSAASNVTGSNSNNIHIGSLGVGGDSSTIRIGATQTSFFAVGIRGVTTGVANAIPVMVDTNGQLGTVSSSIRFKEDVQDMATASSGLMRLRPVTYRYKQAYQDGTKPLDYGLIAEEVAQVYPDLVVKGSDGQLETVQYQKLTPMLLNEVQKQQEQIGQQAAKMEQQSEAIRSLQAELSALKALLPVPAGK